MKREYKKNDFENCTFKGHDKELFKKDNVIRNNIKKAIELSKNSFSLVRNGNILLIGGFYKATNKHFITYLLPTTHFNKNKYYCVKQIIQTIKEFVKNNDVVRICTCSLDDEKINKWHKKLFFIKEGTCVDYIEHYNYNMWRLDLKKYR